MQASGCGGGREARGWPHPGSLKTQTQNSMSFCDVNKESLILSLSSLARKEPVGCLCEHGPLCGLPSNQATIMARKEAEAHRAKREARASVKQGLAMSQRDTKPGTHSIHRHEWAPPLSGSTTRSFPLPCLNTCSRVPRRGAGLEFLTHCASLFDTSLLIKFPQRRFQLIRRT